MHRELSPKSLKLLGIVVLLLLTGVGWWVRRDRLAVELHAAAILGDKSRIRCAVAAGADVNARGQFGSTALITVASIRDAEAIELLLNAGADVNVRDNVTGASPLLQAVLTAPTSPRAALITARLLLSRGADVHAANETGLSPYRLALRWQSRLERNPHHFLPALSPTREAEEAALADAEDMRLLIQELIYHGRTRVAIQ